MTVSELIEQLLTLPPEAKVAVYEAEPDDYVDIGTVAVVDNGDQVNLVSQFAVDAGFA